MRAQRTSCASALLWLAGCAPELPPLQLSTEHVDYYSWNDGYADNTVFARELDERFEAFRDFFAVDPGRLRYYHLDTGSTLAHYCYAPDPPQISGCYYEGQTYALIPLMAHELAHHFGDALGDPPRVFAEGLAMVLSGYAGGGLAKTDGVRDLLDDDYFRGGSRPTRNHNQAMSLTAFLIDEYGLPFVLRIHREMPFGARRAADWLERETGLSLEALTERWHASPVGEEAGSASVHPYECGATIPSVDLAGSSETLFELSKGVGGSLERWRTRARVHLDEPQWFRWSSPDPASVAVKGCGVASAHHLFFPRTPQWSALPAGDHALLVESASDGPSSVHLRWEAVDPPIARECAAASPLLFDGGNGARLGLSLATGLADLTCDDETCVGWVRVASDVDVSATGSVLTVIYSDDDSESFPLIRTLELCEGCTGACRVVEPGTDPPTFRWTYQLAPFEGEVTVRLTLDRGLLSDSSAGVRLDFFP